MLQWEIKGLAQVLSFFGRHIFIVVSESVTSNLGSNSELRGRRSFAMQIQDTLQ